MRYEVEIIERETVWRGYFRMVRYRLRHGLFAGGWGAPIKREVFERGHAAALLPYDPVRDEVLLIEQFRIGALADGAQNPWLVEIVAGIIEDGESAEQVARRETLEESGREVTDIVAIGKIYTTPGASSESIALFCGRIDAAGAGGLFGLAHEGEDIRAFTEPAAAALARVASGEIVNATTLVALQWLALNREDLRARWLAPAPRNGTDTND